MSLSIRTLSTQISSLPPIAQGVDYNTMDDAINAARIHAQKQNFNYKISSRNKSRAVLKCIGNNCQAYVRISFLKKYEYYIVGKFSDQHICQGTLQLSRGTQKDHEFLVHLLQEGMIVNKNTKVKDIQLFLKQYSDIEVPYTTAHKAKESILNESIDAQRQQFSFLLSYIDKLLEVDINTIAKIKTQEENTVNGTIIRFHLIFIAPGAARSAFMKMRRFIAVDGTFTKNRFIQILLLAVGMDAQDQLIILAWAIVPNECEETWSWFLNFLYQVYPSINNQETVIINDREKGLLNAIHNIFPNAFNVYCCWHIASNIQTKFSLVAKKFFWKAAYADSQDKFDMYINTLRKQKEEAAQYIISIPHDHWATYAIKGRRFGHCTSNLAEIANSVLRTIRELPLLEMLNSLYCYQMEKFFKRKEESIKWIGILVPRILEKFNIELINARTMTVYPSSNTTGIVINTNGEQFIIKLPTNENIIGTCTCQFYQNFWIPYSHTCAFAIKVQIAPITLVNEIYNISTYLQTYEKSYIPLVINDLPYQELYPPQIIRPRGRPSIKRKEKGCQSSQVTENTKPICKTCGQNGHNRRTCREAHI